MATKTHKTNAARILDAKGINYELLSYEVDENDLGAENVAQKMRDSFGAGGENAGFGGR